MTNDITYVVMFAKEGQVYMYKFSYLNYMQLSNILAKHAADDQLNLDWDDLPIIIEQAEMLLNYEIRF